MWSILIVAASCHHGLLRLTDQIARKTRDGADGMPVQDAELVGQRIHLVYLVDSIVKTVGEPYGSLFGGRLAEVSGVERRRGMDRSRGAGV